MHNAVYAVSGVRPSVRPSVCHFFEFRLKRIFKSFAPSGSQTI